MREEMRESAIFECVQNRMRHDYTRCIHKYGYARLQLDMRAFQFLSQIRTCTSTSHATCARTFAGARARAHRTRAFTHASRVVCDITSPNEMSRVGWRAYEAAYRNGAAAWQGNKAVIAMTPRRRRGSGIEGPRDDARGSARGSARPGR